MMGWEHQQSSFFSKALTKKEQRIEVQERDNKRRKDKRKEYNRKKKCKEQDHKKTVKFVSYKEQRNLSPKSKRTK